MEKYSQVIFDKNTVRICDGGRRIIVVFLERARDMKRYDL